MNVRFNQPLVPADEFARAPEHFAADQAAFDITALLRILRERRSIVFATIGAVLGLTVAALLILPVTYGATAVMMLDQRKNSVADVNAVLSGLPSDEATIQNQVQVLTSRQLASRVVAQLKLDRDPEFNPELSPSMFGLFSWSSQASHLSIGTEATITKFLKRVSVEQVGLTSAMTISVASSDAAKSARITNALADAYVQDQLGAKFDATQKASKWLANRVREMAAQVQADEAAVQQYKAEHGIVDTTVGGSIVDQQTASVSVQLINARADLAQKTALYNRTLELQHSGRAVEASQVAASPLIAQLRAQEVELQRQEAQFSSRYLPQHPKMVDIASQRRETRTKIGAEVARVIDSLANDVAVSRANVQSLESSLGQLQSKFQNQNSASAKLKALESIATSSRSIYEGLLSRLKEVQGQEGIAAADARIISRAMVPTTASPRPTTVLGVAIPASLVLGLMFAFLAEGIDPSLRSSEHVDKYLGLPVLATLPEVAGQGTKRGAADLIVDDPSSSFAESIRGLYLGLSLQHSDRAPKVLVVTSAVPGEGKTVVAVSLARLAARNGRRVIIVDADFRRPAVAETMSVAPHAGGIVDVLEGRLPLEQGAVRDGRSQAFVLSGARKPVNPSDLLTSDVIEKLIVTLRSRYDLIIVDSAPLLPVHDTLALSEHVDAALFVTHSGKTTRDAVVAALRSLKSTRVAVAGVALTRTKLDPRYYYRDYLYGTPVRSGSDAAASSKATRLPAADATVFGKLKSLVFRPE